MKILHIADLHFGKSLSGLSLLEDQRDWAEKFVDLVKREKPAAVVIAGDVYDRGAPGEDAVALLDEFLTGILAADDQVNVLMVAGNHDSGPKLSFGAQIFRKQRLHIAGQVKAVMDRVILEDEFGPVTFWLLPYTFPAAIQHVLADESLRDYTSAIKALLDRQIINPTERNVLVAHQNVLFDGTEAVVGGSETMIGGVGGVDGTVFAAFDYVALGHIHRAQRIGRETMRYAGSPLCYHFDEVRWGRKGAVCIDLKGKGNVAVSLENILPLHPLREIKGTFEDILAMEKANPADGEYLKVVVTDRRINPIDADTLRALFTAKGSILLELQSDYVEFTAGGEAADEREHERTLNEKFVSFWKARHHGMDPDAETLALIRYAAELADAAQGTSDEDAEKLVKFAVEGS